MDTAMELEKIIIGSINTGGQQTPAYQDDGHFVYTATQVTESHFYDSVFTFYTNFKTSDVKSSRPKWH